MKYYHHDHDHGHTHGEGASALSEAEKARILLSHMLEHNTHHEEEMESLGADPPGGGLCDRPRPFRQRKAHPRQRRIRRS